jgi:hypothetical protein
MKPALATPTMISQAWTCLRTSIFFRQSDAKTNTRFGLTASRLCILASPAQLVSRPMRAQQCKRRKQLMEPASSFSTSCSEVACEVQPKRGGADRNLPFKSGRNGSKIGPYSQLRGQSVGRSQAAPEQIPLPRAHSGGPIPSGYGSKLRCLLLAQSGHAER